MLEKFTPAKADPILGLGKLFTSDERTGKIDLGVGVYKDPTGNTPIMTAVRKAEKYLHESQISKAYKGLAGDEVFRDKIRELVLGDSVEAGRVATLQTPGGTGAIRQLYEVIRQLNPGATIWISDPTWPSHLAMAAAMDLKTAGYTYFDPDTRMVDFDAMMADLAGMNPGDILLLHACCHNPTGFDLSAEQWQAVLEIVKARELLPLVDFAYQGFGNGIDEDAYGARLLAENLGEVLITQSCSKNFGIYRERTGCFIAVAADTEAMEDVRSQLAITARENYSNPPAHGSAIVATIFNDAELYALWHDELAEMRGRINELRQKFVQGLEPHGLAERFAHVAQQRGMFSYTGLSKDQVETLRDEHSIYMVGSGRANVAGLNDANMEYVCNAIASVVK